MEGGRGGRGGQPIARQEPPAHSVQSHAHPKSHLQTPFRAMVASATTIAGGESLTANSKNLPRAGVLLQGPAA